MKPTCPNQYFEFYDHKTFIKKDGYFFRKSESKLIQRFKCTSCSKKFLTLFTHWCLALKAYLSTGISMRKCAILLNVHRTTIERKVVYLAKKEEEDRWKEDRGHWTYALRNRDVDGRDIRIIFDIEAFPDVVVVTVMHVYP